MKATLAAALLLAFATPALADSAGHGHGTQEIVPEALKYVDNPAFPKGAQTVVLVGDPSKPGLFILRAKFPPNYVVPPHTHPVFETVTVLSGTMGSGMGEKVDKAKGRILKAGSVLALEPDHAHYVWAGDEELIIQVSAIGPFDLKYVNPADDPRNK